MTRRKRKCWWHVELYSGDALIWCRRYFSAKRALNVATSRRDQGFPTKLVRKSIRGRWVHVVEWWIADARGDVRTTDGTSTDKAKS